MAFYVLQYGWHMQNNLVAAMLAKLVIMWGNICCFDQNYQPGKIALQDSVLIIKYLIAVSF